MSERMNQEFFCVSRMFAILICGFARFCLGGELPQELKVDATEMAPGVYCLRAGEPESIVPSLVRMPARMEALEAMPKVAQPPLPFHAIKIMRMARGCRIELPLVDGEVIYGLGLQCKHLEQNGWRRTLFTASGDDNGKGMSHAPVPFYVSTAGYGVLVDSARYVTFSVGEKQRLADASSLASNGEQKVITDVAQLYGPERRNVTSVYVDVPAARGVEIYLFAGPNLGQAVARYNLFSGGGCMPAMSGIGPNYIFGTMLDSKSVLEMCDRLKQDRIPVTSVGLEPIWQTHAYSSSYIWNTKKFPSDFGATMREKGYDLNLWCQLYIDPSSPLMPLLNKGFGDFEVWRGVVPDVASAKVREAYSNFLADNFVRKQIAGFKLDEVDGSPNTSPAFQEWQFPEFTSFPSGADGDQLRNLLGRFGMQAIADAFRKGNRRTFSLVRATQAWSASLPTAIYSDEYNFADYVRYNLSAGMQGVLWAPEIRNAENERDWALRVGAATFSARMIYNGWQFPNFPWQQPNLAANERGQFLPTDNFYSRIARRFNNLRMALLPYIYQAYFDYHCKGIPPIRPLVSDWPEDSNTRHIDDQWMLGSDLLVAPLTEANSFSASNSLAVTDPSRFQPLNGPCRITADKDVIQLEMNFDNEGIKGARTPLELQAGMCCVRFSYQADVGNVGIRMWTPEGNEVNDFHIDNLASAKGWQICEVKAKLPKTGTYSFYIGKSHPSTGARRIAFRNLTILQKSHCTNSNTCWSREIYLPSGNWRDFWTGQALKGERHHVITATPERIPVFVREGTLLPMANPLVTLDDKTVFSIHLAAYGEKLRSCQLLEDDGSTFAYESGTWATLIVAPDGTVQRPDHGQPQRYIVAGPAENGATVIEQLLPKDLGK